MSIAQLTPQQVQDYLKKQSAPLLLDVREEDEVRLCALPGSLHIPMNLIPLRHNELPDDIPIIVYCHHGIRSLNVARYLAHVGFENVANLQGGIDAWARQIDPSLPRY